MATPLQEKINKSYKDFKDNLSTVPTDKLKSLEFFVESFPKMGHQILCTDNSIHKSIDADGLRWLIAWELGNIRKEGELPYTWEEMYFALKIPKEFLR